MLTSSCLESSNPRQRFKTREINNATIGEAGAEAVVPLHKLGGMMRDAMAGVVAENRRLVEESKRQTEAIGKVGNNVAGALVDMA